MQYILILCYLIPFLTPSHGATIAGSTSITQGKNITNPMGANQTLEFDPNLPWGPDEFSSVISIPSEVSMDSMNCYMFAIDLLSKLVAQDFNGNMPETMNSFTNAQYPGIFAGASARDGDRPLPRRYVLWALARTMNYVVTNGFRGGVFQIVFRGQDVGKLVLTGPIRSADQTLSSAIVADFGNSFMNSTDQTSITQSPSPIQQMQNMTTATVGDEQLAWTHEFIENGDLMEPKDVFMGAIGSLVEVAQVSQDQIFIFVGGFPQYKAIYNFKASTDSPIRLDHHILAQTIFNLAAEARRRMDFHEQKTTVKTSGRLVASGGYIRNPMVSLVSDNLNVTTS